MIPANRTDLRFGAARVAVGDARDPDRLLHLRDCGGFAVGPWSSPGSPLADMALFQRICAEGGWNMAMRLATRPLRRPEEILAAEKDHCPDTVLTTLTLAEAEGLARAANGRLPDETEMERILGDAPHILSRLPPNIDIWTSSPWSAWSYRLVVPSDHVNVKWLAHPSRILPDVAATSPVCQFRMVSPPARRVAQPDYTGACVMVRDLPPGGGPSR